jgi:chromosome segregation ATPase
MPADCGKLRLAMQTNDVAGRLRIWADGLEILQSHAQALMARTAADEIERLRSVVEAWLKYSQRAEREIERLRAERDEVRQSYCSLMEAYRGGDGRVTANKLGWGYLFEEDKPCQ